MLPPRDLLPIAIRVYPVFPIQEDEKRKGKGGWWPLPRGIFVFDTETRTDSTQRLTFGGYRFLVDWRCVEEGLFYGDDLSRGEIRTLQRYARTHKPTTISNGNRKLRLLPLRRFNNELFSDIYKSRCLLVAFNHPFDLSRIARDFGDARGRQAGGFSLGIWTYLGKDGYERRNRYRPRITIKHIDSKRALIALTSRVNPDVEDRIPEESKTGKPKKGYNFKGHFLDLRTLAFALTDVGHSLESACEAFDVEHKKQKVHRHGKITAKYIDYNRRDVLASSELALKLIEEFEKHHIPLQVTKAFSPASVGKAYLKGMRIDPVMVRQPDFTKQFIGYAQSAFYGGRTSAHIRKVPVPVVYVDFRSMYPTVNALMGLWELVTAEKILVKKNCRSEIVGFLRKVSARRLFSPSTWQHLLGFVRVIPNDDILPSRSKYSVESNDWQVALNYLTGLPTGKKDALWFALPDVVASVLLTGKIPKIVDAFQLQARGTLNHLQSVRLRGDVRVNPASQDFFKVVIEQRNLLKTRKDLSEVERSRLDKALKVLANAASYGIYAEMNRRESDHKIAGQCFGIDPKPYPCKVSNPEAPGQYCFPPFASLITAAARLMLALLEHCVTESNGTYAMEDTDSMAIVATEHGGMIPCVGGPYRTDDGHEAIKALSRKKVEDISKRFGSLNPYDRKAVPDSILKIEKDNFHPITNAPRQIFCLAISAKRYALFLKDENGKPILLRATCPFCGRKNKPAAKHCRNCRHAVSVSNEDDRWSEHGLGHLLNPADPEREDREWIAQVWLNIIRKALGFRPKAMRFKDLPAVGRITVSSPAVMDPLKALNRGKRYSDQIKPFNFLNTCHVAPFGHPPGIDPEHFHLIGPYENRPRRWLKKDWIDQYSGKSYRITTSGFHGKRETARVKTYGEVVDEYEFHPESKCSDTKGDPCRKQTIGLLQRRRIQADEIKPIGKESNVLEDVGAGSVHSAEDAYTEYTDPNRSEWETKIRPALKTIPLKVLVKKCEGRLSRRAIIDIRAGRSRPHRKNRELLALVFRKISLTDKSHRRA